MVLLDLGRFSVNFDILLGCRGADVAQTKKKNLGISRRRRPARSAPRMRRQSSPELSIGAATGSTAGTAARAAARDTGPPNLRGLAARAR